MSLSDGYGVAIGTYGYYQIGPHSTGYLHFYVPKSSDGELVTGSTQDTSVGSGTIGLESTVISNTGGTDACASQYEVQSARGNIASDFTYATSRNGVTAMVTFAVSGGSTFPAALLNDPLIY